MSVIDRLLQVTFFQASQNGWEYVSWEDLTLTGQSTITIVV